MKTLSSEPGSVPFTSTSCLDMALVVTLEVIKSVEVSIVAARSDRIN
jgi:hypothetical protein